MQGKLIVFEGTDGSGKATQSRLLCEELTRRGIPFRKLEFPRYQEESSALIRLYLGGAFGDKPGDVNAYAASVFYSVDRYASYKQDWGAYYEQGGLVIADRYTTATPFTRPVSCRRSSGTVFSTGCLTSSTGCWGCRSPHGCCIWICPQRPRNR